MVGERERVADTVPGCTVKVCDTLVVLEAPPAKECEGRPLREPLGVTEAQAEGVLLRVGERETEGEEEALPEALPPPPPPGALRLGV